MNSQYFIKLKRVLRQRTVRNDVVNRGWRHWWGLRWAEQWGWQCITLHYNFFKVA